MRDLVKKVIKILRDPIWESFSCLFGFIAIFGTVIIAILLAIKRSLEQLISYLTEPLMIPRITVYFLFLVLAWTIIGIVRPLIVKAVYKTQSETKIGKKHGDYYLIWDVLWKLHFTMSGRHLAGPYCPVHYLEMPMLAKDGEFSFYCSGGEGTTPHILQGPKESELIPRSSADISSPNDWLKQDVTEQILAEIRMHGNG